MIGVPHTDETRDAVRSLWQAGKTSGQIAIRLGMTRNAVVGVVTRGRKDEGELAWPSRMNALVLDVMTRRKAERKARRTAPKRSKRSLIPAKPKCLPTPAPEPIEKPIGTIAWMDRELNQCAYIESEVGDVHSLQCCGAPTEFGSSWCKYHRFIVYGADVTSKEAKSFRLSRIGVGG